MKVMPTMEGGLRLEIESSSDWTMLAQIPNDASEDLALTLPEVLGDLMDDDSEWDDLVVPDLHLIFSSQLAQVASAVSEAQGKGDAPTVERLVASRRVDSKIDDFFWCACGHLFDVHAALG